MHSTARLIVALALGALASTAHATNGMRMSGFGAVQNGMGGVGVGATLDANAVVTNPAGLTELDRRLDASVTWFQPTVEYQATGADVPYVNRNGATMKSNRGGSPVPNLGAAFPLGYGLTAGVGAFGVGGMGVDYDANLYSGKTLTSYQLMRVAPAIAWKAHEVLSLGLAVNLSWAQMKYDVASGFGQQPHAAADAFGSGYTLAAKLTPMRQVTFGLAYESRTTFEDFRFDIPAHTGMTPGGPFPFPGGQDKLTFHQPPVLSFGFAWQVLPALLVAGDVQAIDWQKTNGPGMPAFSSDTRQTGSMPFNLGWERQYVYKLGVQVQALPALKVRAGWNFGEHPLAAGRAFENIAFPAIAEHHLAAGLGWQALPSLEVNAGATYAPKVTVKGANAAEQGILAYSTSMSQLAIDLGVAWKF